MLAAVSGRVGFFCLFVSLLNPKPSGVSVSGHLVIDQRGIRKTWVAFLKRQGGVRGGMSRPAPVGLAGLVTLESPLFSVFVTSPRTAERQR